ncbi:hypothetical protein ACQX06_06660 [Corynebacterium diphtheriae]
MMHRGKITILIAALAASTISSAPPTNAQVQEIPSETDSITIPYVLSDTPPSELADVPSESQISAEPLAASYGPCTLTIDNVHNRKSSNWGAVGFKARTECSQPVTSIHHSSDLRYKYYAWWNKALSNVTATAYNTNHLVQKNVTLQCNGDVSTKFAGVTLGTIVYNGKTYYARNYSKVATLNCKV